MKFTTLFAALVFIALNSFGQTDIRDSKVISRDTSTVITDSSITRHDSTVVKIKNDRLPRAKVFNSWNIGGHIGFTFPNTDIAASDLNGNTVERRLAFGLDITKFLSHTVALQLRGMHANLAGVDDNKQQYQYKTTIKYDISLNAIFQIGNVSFLQRTPNLAFYGGIGFGFMNYTPEVSVDGGKTNFSGIYSQYKDPLEYRDYDNTTDFVIPFTLGVKYRVARRVSLNLEYNLRTTNSDKLDGWVKLLSEDDDYTYFNIGATVHLGGRDRMLEWINPLDILYTDVYDMKDQIDRLGADSDSDGVADRFDREAMTPVGTKVYGDGTSIDSDGDGVPDTFDAEPFSAKNAQVDASGKEIDSDNDGIPDSRDSEPNTPKGTLVDANGMTIRKGDMMAPKGYIPSIFFGLDDATVSPKYKETLANIVLLMRNNPELKFIISGNCDQIASAEYNMKLGKKRAEAVKQYLVKNYNIDENRLIIETLGKSDPITQGLQTMNRRVDIRVKE